MGIVSNLLGSTPIATSAMKGQKYAAEHPDNPSGGYGQTGIVGTILKMYLGGGLGGALGGAAGGGASGMAGAANGMSGVTSGLTGGSGLGGMLGGGGGGGGIMGGSQSIGGGLGDAGASLSQGIGGAGNAMMDQLGNTDWMGVAGDMVQKGLGSSSGGSGGQGSGQVGMQAQAQQTNPNMLEDMMARMQSMAGNAQKNQTGLMSIPGIPDYFKQQMQGWQ